MNWLNGVWLDLGPSENLRQKGCPSMSRRVGVLTSGGDAPGMNAAIRTVVRAAIHYNMEPMAIYRGYHGLIRGEIEPLTSRSVSGIIQRGGTVLKSARSDEFKTPEGRQKAV